jgi:hypothetical protein
VLPTNIGVRTEMEGRRLQIQDALSGLYPSNLVLANEFAGRRSARYKPMPQTKTTGCLHNTVLRHAPGCIVVTQCPVVTPTAAHTCREHPGTSYGRNRFLSVLMACQEQAWYAERMQGLLKISCGTVQNELRPFTELNSLDGAQSCAWQCY